MANPIVTITMENGDVMKAELYPDVAPITVENFVNLVKDGFYDGLTFHRVINGFMIQGGCPLGTGTGGPGHTIKGEFSQNGVINNLKHTPGVLSMARSMMPDSAGSQFFIMHKAAPHLDGQYAAFGKIIEGMAAGKFRQLYTTLHPVGFPSRCTRPTVGAFAAKPRLQIGPARARLRTKPALEKRRCKTGYSRLDSNHPHEYSGIRHRRR